MTIWFKLSFMLGFYDLSVKQELYAVKLFNQEIQIKLIK